MVENFRHKLEDFKQLVGTVENYTFFEDFYREIMNKLEHKCNILENGGNETALNTKPNNLIIKLLKNIFSNLKKEDFSLQ